MDSKDDRAINAPELNNSHQAPEAVTNHAESPQVWHPQPPSHSPPYQNGGYGSQEPAAIEKGGSSRDEKSRKVAGLAPWAFWTLIGVIALIVIGASVGGAVGGSKAAKNNNSSPNASSSTATGSTPSGTSSAASSTSSSSAQPSSSASSMKPTTDCPGSNGTTYNGPAPLSQGSSKYTFTKLCNENIDGGDIASTYVQTFDTCIDTCSNWNYLHSSDGLPKCVGVVYNEQVDAPDNCWIKSLNASHAIDGGAVALLN